MLMICFTDSMSVEWSRSWIPSLLNFVVSILDYFKTVCVTQLFHHDTLFELKFGTVINLPRGKIAGLLNKLSESHPDTQTHTHTIYTLCWPRSHIHTHRWQLIQIWRKCYRCWGTCSRPRSVWFLVQRGGGKEYLVSTVCHGIPYQCVTLACIGQAIFSVWKMPVSDHTTCGE